MLLSRPIYLSSSFFVSYRPSSLNGTQPKLAACSEVRAIWKCMSEILGIPSPANLPQNHLFRWLRNLTATLTAYIFRTKRAIHNRQVRWKLQDVSYIASKLWSTKGINWRVILLTLRTLCILLHCRASQTDFSKLNSTKLCQTADNKSH